MRRAWIAGALVAALIAGCGGGGGSGPQTARDVAEAYVSARNSGDAGKVCELYSQQLIQQLRTSDCVGFVKEHTSGTATDLTVVHVVQHGSQATATIQAKVGEMDIALLAARELWRDREKELIGEPLLLEAAVQHRPALAEQSADPALLSQPLERPVEIDPTGVPDHGHRGSGRRCVLL